METVYLVECHYVKDSLDFIGREEMAAGINQHSAVGEAGAVGNAGILHAVSASLGFGGEERWRKHLRQGMDGIQEAAPARGCDQHPVMADVNPICIGGISLRCGYELHALSECRRIAGADPVF